jgi:hypothetical protein
MGQGPGQGRPRELADDRDKSPDQLRAEIEDVRGDLGETAEALAAKTDVKARAEHKAEELKQAAAAKKDQVLGATPGAGAAAGGAGSAVSRVQTAAREHPVLAAAGVALVGGILIGRLSGRGG